MSIRFKFRSSVNYETLQLDGWDSISVRELRARIIGGKSFGGVQQPQQGFDLVFADALSGQEYKGDDFQIPTGSSVIVKRVPGGAVPLSVVSPPIEAVKDLGMRDSFPLNPANETMDAFDDFGAELCPLPDSNVQHFDLQINRDNLMGNQKKEIDGLRLESQKLDSDVTGPTIPEGNDRNLMLETKAKGHLTSNKLIRSNFPVSQSSDLPPEMKCALCNTIFKEAMTIPCCQHSFCENCIRLVLIEEKRCPKCFSTKYNVEDLLPNLSLRQAIERFLESQILDAGLEKTMQKDVPDGESRIEAKEDVSCALTRDKKSGLLEQKDKHLHDSRVVYSHHHDIMQRGSEPFTPVADFQGENQPVVLPQANNPDKVVIPETTTHSPPPQSPEDHIPLVGRKRKAVSIPETILIEDETALGSPPATEIQEPTTSSPASGQMQPRLNLFLEGATSSGVRLLKSMLLPVEEAHLKNIMPSPKLFEGSNRVLSGVQMLILAFEEVAAMVTKEGNRARAIQELHQQLQGELERARLIHEGAVAGLRTQAEVANQQLLVAQADLEKVRADVDEGLVREEVLRGQVAFLEARDRTLVEELEVQQARAVAAEMDRDILRQSKENFQTSFRESPEFAAAVEDKSYAYFKVGFSKCKEQFEEENLLPVDKPGLPDLDRAIVSLFKEDLELEKEDSEDSEGAETGEGKVEYECILFLFFFCNL